MDERAQELQRQIATGDPAARSALFLHLARASDPHLLQAAALRRELRVLLWRVLDRTSKSSHAPFAPVISAIARTIQGEEPVTFTFRELEKGPWDARGRVAVAVLVVRLEDEVYAGIGASHGINKATLGALWREFYGLPRTVRASTAGAQLEVWARGQRTPSPQCLEQGVVQLTRTQAAELCQFAAWAGPRGHALWALVDPAPVRNPRELSREDATPYKKDLARLAAARERYSPSELSDVYLEHIGHRQEDLVSRPEAKHLLALLEAWSGQAASLSAEDLVRVHGYRSRLDLGEAQFTALLNEIAGVDYVDEVHPDRLAAVIAHLQALERKRGGRARAATTPPAAALGAWLLSSKDEFPAELRGAESAAELRRLGASWDARVSLANRRVAAPAPEAPSVAWTTKVPGRVELQRIVASPVGVAVLAPKQAFLLDPDTGQLRAELPRAGSAFFLGEVLVLTLGRRTLGGFCARTGERLFSAACQTTWAEGQLSGSLFLSGTGRAYRFEDPRQAPTHAWSVSGSRVRGLNTIAEQGLPWGALLSHRRFVTQAETTLQVFDDCGSLLAEVPAPPARTTLFFADDAGLVVAPERCRSEYERPMKVALLGREGERLCELTDPGLPLALGPDSLVFLHGRRLRWRARIDGELRAESAPLDLEILSRDDCWLHEETLVLAARLQGEVRAYREGELQWSVPTGKASPGGFPAYPRIAAGYGRVYALKGRREVICLE